MAGPTTRADAPDGDVESTTGRKRTSGPRLPRVYIPRHRLWEQLDRATEGAVTLLVAPGGAGKTLGVGGWLQVSSVAQAYGATWLQGDDPAVSGHLERLLATAPPEEPTEQADG